MSSHPAARPPLAEHGYQDLPTVPSLHIVPVVTGTAPSPIMDPDRAPTWLRDNLAHWVADTPRAVLVMDFGDSRWEAETLLSTLASAASVVRGAADGDVVMVISTTQPSVAQLARMISAQMDVPLYIADSPTLTGIADASPAGRLTATEYETLNILRRMGGRGTANSLASEASLAVTAAGNRLGNLAKRGYVSRVPRSRREGDEYVSPAGLLREAH